MAGWIKNWAMVLLLIVLIYPSAAKMSYDIVASAGGPSFEVHHSTKYMKFTADSSIRGIGNFSRLNSITDIMGLTAKEATSATKNGTLDYAEQIRLTTSEGPVIVTVNHNSYNFTDKTAYLAKFRDSALIDVDERWPTNFVDLKKIAYAGPRIRSREIYENNGDAVATSINSWKLSKQSIYRASSNRTIIFASISPSDINVDVAANRSSSYSLGLKSIGELTSLDVIKNGSSGNAVSRITQDFRGSQSMTLTINMFDHVLKPPADFQWLDCCPPNSIFERLFGNKGI
jgi:hypothetical protein